MFWLYLMTVFPIVNYVVMSPSPPPPPSIALQEILKLNTYIKQKEMDFDIFILFFALGGVQFNLRPSFCM
jgi:hypothetical protein